MVTPVSVSSIACSDTLDILPSTSTVNCAMLPESPYVPAVTPVCSKSSVTVPDVPPPSKPVPATTLCMSPCINGVSVTFVTIPFSSTVTANILPVEPYVPAVTPELPNSAATVPGSKALFAVFHNKA